MLVGVLGLNHKSADLSLRDCLAKVCERRFSAGRIMHAHHSFVLLSTCNRTEVYFSSDDLAATHSYLLRQMRYDISEEFEHKLYSYFGYDCFAHLSKVTAGMDSAILAETEIQGQVKTAYEKACESIMLPKEIHFIFQKSLKIGKEVRTALPISKGPSLERAVMQRVAEFSQNIQSLNYLFIGASEINLKVHKELLLQNVNSITFCNRTLERLKGIDVKVLPWDQRSDWTHFDVVIVGTKAQEYLLLKEHLIHTMNRKLLIDLSVPRNIDPELARNSMIHLLNVDQINQMQDKKKVCLTEFDQIEKIILNSVENQIEIFKAKSSFNHLSDLKADPYCSLNF